MTERGLSYTGVIDLSHPLRPGKEPRWSKPRLMTKAAEVHV